MKINSMMMYMMISLSIIWGWSSNNWFSLWFSMEMNSLMFIPLISNKVNQTNTESAMKYFLIQSISSMMFMSAIVMDYMTLMNNYTNLIMITALIMKMGMFPFMMWMVEVINKVSFNNILMISTIQKIIPMISIKMACPIMNPLMKIILMMNLVIGALWAINTTKIKMIMACSSMTQSSWMTTSIFISSKSFLMFMSIYSVIMIMIMYSMNSQVNKSLNQLFTQNDLTEKMQFLSLFGLPPLSGFVMKWLIIQNLINNNEFLMPSLLVITSVVTLFYYLRISTSSLVMNYPSTKKNNNNKKKILNILTLMLTPITLTLMSM